MVAAKVIWLTGIGSLIGTNVGWYYVLKQPQLTLQQNPEYLFYGAIAGGIIGGVIGYIWDKHGG